MAQLSTFTGFTADGYRFLMELEFNNEKAFVTRTGSGIMTACVTLCARLPWS